MKDRLLQWGRRLEAFHNDERGEQNMSSVMLLGVGALVVVGLIAIGAFIFKWMNSPDGPLHKATDDPNFQKPS